MLTEKEHILTNVRRNVFDGIRRPYVIKSMGARRLPGCCQILSANQVCICGRIQEAFAADKARGAEASRFMLHRYSRFSRNHLLLCCRHEP